MNEIDIKHSKLKDILQLRTNELITINKLINTIDVFKLIATGYESIKDNELNVFIPIMKIDLKSFVDLLVTLDFIKLNKCKVYCSTRVVPIHFDGLFVNKQMIETDNDYGYIDYNDTNTKYREIYKRTNNSEKGKELVQQLNPFIDINSNFVVSNVVSNGENQNNEIERLDLYSKLYISDLIDGCLITHDKEQNKMIIVSSNKSKKSDETKIEIDVDETNNYFWSYTYLTECIMINIR